jgi:hypothetical protein
MAHDTLLTIFVMLTALALTGQAAVMLGLYFSLRNVPRQIEDIRRIVNDRVDPLLDSVREIVSNSREPVRTITSNVAELSQVVRERASSVDLLLADVLEKSRAQIIRVDRLITDLTQKVETTAGAVERGVRAPAQEVSAVVAGVRTGLEFLFSGKRRKPDVDQVSQDEELFI